MKARPAFVAALLFAPSLLLCTAVSPALAHPEPRLRIARDRPVHPGEWIEIEFDGPIDGIDEFEILLSVDGGRHYTRQISSELNPHTPRFMWQVPNVDGTELRLRLRYHRGGRETEADAYQRLEVVARGDVSADHNALLPREGVEPEAPRSDRGRESRPTNTEKGVGENENPSPGRCDGRRMACARDGSVALVGRTTSVTFERSGMGAAPRFVPPRK